jgi:hypothetical protein
LLLPAITKKITAAIRKKEVDRQTDDEHKEEGNDLAT